MQGHATVPTTEPLSSARAHHDHPAGVPGEVLDPVCGMTVDPATAEQRADHAGHRYFFCSGKCRERFTANPDRYLALPRSSDAPAARSAAPDEVLWTCPMHPQIVRKEPGSCPICGMALERMTPEEGDAANPELRDMTRRFWVGVALKALRDEHIRVVMLTGDSRTTAEAVGRKLGIDDVVAEVLPDQKAAAVKKFQDQRRFVAMAGDGINDAPALAQAQVGIAMGTGADVAMESAAVTLIKGDLQGIVRARHLSRATMRNIRQNLFFAFIFNALAVPIARVVGPATGYSGRGIEGEPIDREDKVPEHLAGIPEQA